MALLTRIIFFQNPSFLTVLLAEMSDSFLSEIPGFLRFIYFQNPGNSAIYIFPESHNIGSLTKFGIPVFLTINIFQNPKCIINESPILRRSCHIGRTFCRNNSLKKQKNFDITGTGKNCVRHSDEITDCRTLASPWGNEDTQILIDILGQYGVKATFFVVGDWVDKYPESVRALSEAGHEVMNHSNHHDHYNSLSSEQISADVSACAEKIEAVTGSYPKLFRCPYGEYDDHVIAAVKSIGVTAIQWDVDSLDWKEYDAQTIYARVTQRVQPGSIVLFHNAALHTPEALGSIIEYLMREGYSIVPVSQLLLTGDTVIDHTGRQLPV